MEGEMMGWATIKDKDGPPTADEWLTAAVAGVLSRGKPGRERWFQRAELVMASNDARRIRVSIRGVLHAYDAGDDGHRLRVFGEEVSVGDERRDVGKWALGIMRANQARDAAEAEVEAARGLVFEWLARCATVGPPRRVLALAVGIMLECEMNGTEPGAVAEGVAFSARLRAQGEGGVR